MSVESDRRRSVKRTVLEIIAQLIACGGESVKEGGSAHIPKPVVHPGTRKDYIAGGVVT